MPASTKQTFGFISAKFILLEYPSKEFSLQSQSMRWQVSVVTFHLPVESVWFPHAVAGQDSLPHTSLLLHRKEDPGTGRPLKGTFYFSSEVTT